MKKYLLLLFAAFATVCPSRLSALSLYVDDTDVVSITANWKEIPGEFVNSGRNLNNLMTGSMRLMIVCNDGYIIKSITIDNVIEYDYSTAEEAKSNAVWEFDDIDCRPSVITVFVQKVEPLLTGSFKIVSDAATWKVLWSLPFGAQDKLSHNVLEGEQEIAMIPGRDTSVKFSRLDLFGCYSLKRNGELVEYDAGYDYVLPLEDGDVFELTTIAPDQKCRVNISSPNGDDDFFTRVYYKTYSPDTDRYSLVEVEEWNSFEAPAGCAVGFEFNYLKYKEPEHIFLNGIDRGYELIMEWNCEFPVDRDVVDLSIPAEEFGPVEIIVDVDDPSRVSLSLESENSTFDLVAGENRLGIMENLGLRLSAGATGIIQSVVMNGRELVNSGSKNSFESQVLSGPYYWGLYYPEIPYGTWEITTAPRERAIPVKVFVEGCDGSARLWTTSYGEPYFFELHEGENHVLMHWRDMGALSVDFNTGESSPEGKIYVNGAYISTSARKNTFSFKFAESLTYGVIRIYGDESDNQRTLYKVKVTSEFAESEYELYNDYVIPCKGRSYHNVLDGSLFHVNMVGDEASDVYVNGEKLASENPMMHTFVVTGPTELQIKKQVSGVDEVTVGDNDTPVYYNLQGIKVENPHGGVFVEVKGGKATRKLIR